MKKIVTAKILIEEENCDIGLNEILFQYPDNTKCSYDLDTQLEIAALPGVHYTKNGVRNMKRWDTEIPVLRQAFPELTIMSCHDEYLLHTIFDVDGLLVGYGNIAPELLIALLKAGQAHDYDAVRAVHDRLLPVTSAYNIVDFIGACNSFGETDTARSEMD